MSKFKIKGPCKLHGEIRVSGAKNAALKILPASILADTPSTITNIPDITDVRKMIEILESIGAKIEFDGEKAIVDPRGVNSYTPDDKLMKQLRGSIVLIGPLLAKFAKASFSQPGGCLIGARPIDDHLDIFAQMGVKVSETEDKYFLKGKPRASKIILNKMSVTATENAIMASVLSPGKTHIHVAAAEPEIADLAKFLNSMGAKIEGAGTHDITIEGVNKLYGSTHEIIPDRIEAGTFLILGLATDSRLKIGPIVSNHLSLVLHKLEKAGAKFKIFIKDGKEYIETLRQKGFNAIDIDTRTYPGFPTDLQSPMVVLLTQAKGESNIFETIFEGRFLYIDELQMMGANIEIISPHKVTIKGATLLKGKEIYSRDLRGGAALVIAGLIASGNTTINGLDYIDRGYEKIDEKLKNIGADIRRIEE